jgi:nucleotide-binding universal stress UspA family protein
MSHGFSEPHRLTLTHIFHPTDFLLSPEVAFAHALKLTLATKAKLTVFHVNKGLESTEFEDFPHVRDTLTRWGLGSDADFGLEMTKVGISIEKILAHGHDPTASILAYLERHPAGLIVLATHQLGGQPFFQSIAEPVARRAGVMTLFIPPDTKGFVRGEDGAFTLRRILIPIDHHPNPQTAIQAVSGLVQALDCEKVAFTLLHVGAEEDVPFIYQPRRSGWTWHLSIRTGDVVSQIIQCEREEKSDLIVMTTEGHQGFLDALRGNTTEQVLRNARCPILAVPAE